MSLPPHAGRVLQLDLARRALSLAIPAASGDVREEARWREELDQAPALVYLLASNRTDAYVPGLATDRASIAAVQARVSGTQSAALRQWPALAWLQAMPGQKQAERRLQRLRQWPHDWQRHLIQSSNPGWVDLDDLLFHRPVHTRHPIPECGLALPQGEDAVRACAEVQAARQAIHALPARDHWQGAKANWWYAQVKAAPWLVSAFSCERNAYRIVCCPGRVLESTMARLLGYNRVRELAGSGRPPWRWLWLEPHASQAEARIRAHSLQQWPASWVQTLIAGTNPAWQPLDGLLAGYHPEQRNAASVPMA